MPGVKYLTSIDDGVQGAYTASPLGDFFVNPGVSPPDLAAVVVIHVRRTDGYTIQSSSYCRYDGVDMVHLGTVYLNNDDGASSGFIILYGLGGQHGTVAPGYRNIEYRINLTGLTFCQWNAGVMCFENVASMDSATTNFGTETGTTMATTAISSKTGDMVTGALSHASTSAITNADAGSWTIRRTLDQSSYAQTTVIGTGNGAATKQFTSSRASGVDYCGAILNLYQRITSGTMGSTMKPVGAAALSGTQGMSGTIAAQAAKLASYLFGSQRLEGQLAATAPKTTFVGDAAQRQTGTIAATAKSPLFSGSGTYTETTGTIAVGFQPMIFAGTPGIIEGIVAATAKDPVIEMLGSHTISSGMEAALKKMTMAASGTQRQTGVLAAVAKDPVASLSGYYELKFFGQLAATKTKPSIAMVGSHYQTGVLNANLIPVRVAIAAKTGPQGIIAVAIPRPRIATAWGGFQVPAGALSASLPKISFLGRLGIVLPANATVLTLSGLNFNLYNDMPEKFQGIFNVPPYVLRKIEYPASVSKQSIVRGVAALDEALMTTSGNIIVLAQSQGAQVCSRWMRQYGADIPANATRRALASRVTFLLTGNPLRSLNGDAIGKMEVDGQIGIPTPTDTPWPIIDVARRYDGWADKPTDPNNELAVKNAASGKSAFHIAYDEVNLYDTTHTIWRIGNTTYVLTAEAAPFLRKLQIPVEVKISMQQKIEDGYNNRPPSDPPITGGEVNTVFWETVLEALGIL